MRLLFVFKEKIMELLILSLYIVGVMLSIGLQIGFFVNPFDDEKLGFLSSCVHFFLGILSIGSILLLSLFSWITVGYLIQKFLKELKP
jgi:hypothetical protein